jgi:maltooligosyltrehalose trehalohydrolase
VSGGFAHAMPFGAAVQAEGEVRFRLWAPSQDSVSLVLEGPEERVLPMTGLDEGWFELTTDEARAGSVYRYQLGDGFRIPDPASRQQLDDVHGASLVVDPTSYRWRHPAWRGRPWHETVLYELHLGCYSRGGDFDGLRAKLDDLARLGITAIELMPIADFPGRHNWGYDGVLPFAPDRSYGTPDQLKALIEAAHERELMVFLDVVYNHFGPEGNYLHLIAEAFFTERFETPWGAAIDFSRVPVRDFFIHNALYWLEEYRFDGLRFDAVHAIEDESERHFLQELAARLREAAVPGREIHLVLENDKNEARRLAREQAPFFDAQWNDDYHHAAHVIATREAEGYYADYQDDPVALLGRCLAEGFAYQGEPSSFRDQEIRGEPSAELPATAFVDFLQNHDQIGNRAFGERLTELASEEAQVTLLAITLLAPSIPLIFMGEEWGCERPFLYFTDFEGSLADAVRQGRRREFARFAAFADPQRREAIPDPNARETFEASCLDWKEREEPKQRQRLELTRRLLEIRHSWITPRLFAVAGGSGRFRRIGARGLEVQWRLGSGDLLNLTANLGGEAFDEVAAEGRLLYRTRESGGAWSCHWRLNETP